jgi:iron(III) transport system ATP-binding protein
VLLFDEPLSNLDANLRRSMRDKIRELQKQFNITSLYVTHDQSEAFAVSDTVLVMNKGISCRSARRRIFIASPRRALWRVLWAMPTCSRPPSARIRRYLWLSAAEAAAFCRPRRGTVGVRPEAITLSDRGEESQRCTIRHVAYMGPQYEVTVEWHGQEILLQVNATRLQPDVGEHYYLEIHPYGMFVLADAG